MMEEPFDILTTEELDVDNSIFELVSEADVPDYFPTQGAFADTRDPFESDESALGYG